MNLVLLGGVNPHNQEWLRDVEKTLSPLFDSCLVQDYAHWTSATPQIDLEHELGILRHRVRDLEPYAIFAKSAGVVLTLKGIAEKTLHPQACLFVGTPLAFAIKHGHQLDQWLKHLNVPTVFAQNAHDPTGSYHELERFLRQHLQVPHYKVIELPGETHDYTDLSRIKDLAAEILPG
jgi:hypothetical protein